MLISNQFPWLRDGSLAVKTERLGSGSKLASNCLGGKVYERALQIHHTALYACLIVHVNVRVSVGVNVLGL